MPQFLAINLQGDNLTIALIGIVLALLQIYAIMRPNPALHEQFAGKKEIQEIKTLLLLEQENGREDRRQIYHRLNKCENGLSFIAGRLERKRDTDGGKLRQILRTEDISHE
jgi:hypothetical protein